MKTELDRTVEFNNSSGIKKPLVELNDLGFK